MKRIKQEWFFNVQGDLLSGLVVALALIPEAIAFSIIAGVAPKVGLYASFCIATVIAFSGGRPGMISAATGAMALVMITLVKDHGLQYLFAATILTGVLQIIAGWVKLGELMRFVSRSVIIGFVNALAILIFMAQLPELINVTWHVYVLTAVGLAIIYLFPFVTKKIPSPLVTILLLTCTTLYFDIEVRTVGDMGSLPDSLPVFLVPQIPFTLETLGIIFPYALTLALVGLLESMMTASIVDDMTETDSHKNKECVGQGIANITTGFFGGMAGCAMIGQSVINIKSGGRGRLSALTAGVLLLILVVFAGQWVAKIPMAALVAVMIMVSIGTFNWDSLRYFRSYPMSSNIVMISTVMVVLYTHDLAKGVLVGVLLSGIFFAYKISKILEVVYILGDGGKTITYEVKGQVFFASAHSFIKMFNFAETPQKVLIDVHSAHFWDVSAIAALDKVVLKFRKNGVEVEVLGLNEASLTMVDNFAIHNKKELSDFLVP